MAGTFYARESVSALYSFVREALRDDWLPFELLGPGGLKLTDENLAFNECGLVSKKKKKIAGTFHRVLQAVSHLLLVTSESSLCLLLSVPQVVLWLFLSPSKQVTA